MKKYEKQRIVNILGMSPNNTWLPDHGERWGINLAMGATDRLDKWFIMDGIKAMYESCGRSGVSVEQMFQFIKENPEMNIISAFAEPFIYAGEEKAVCQPYPIAEVNKLLPGVFMNSSIAAILAYACVQEELGYQPIDQINIYGIEMWATAETDEYHYQKECVDFWIPFCLGKGIKINVPAFLLYARNTTHNLYGYYREDIPTT